MSLLIGIKKTSHPPEGAATNQCQHTQLDRHTGDNQFAPQTQKYPHVF
jgi:hypothetical protein